MPQAAAEVGPSLFPVGLVEAAARKGQVTGDEDVPPPAGISIRTTDPKDVLYGVGPIQG